MAVARLCMYADDVSHGTSANSRVMASVRCSGVSVLHRSAAVIVPTDR